jgi:hypothetical protein
MPDVRPFRGIRYDMAEVGALSDVVAPPYDVIGPELAGPALRGQPLQRHPPGAEPRGARRHRRGQPLHPRRRDAQGLAPPGRPPRGPPPLAVRLPPDVRGRGPDVHPQGLPRPGPPGALRPGPDLPPRADPLGPEGRPPGALPGHRVQPQPHLRPLPRRRRRGAPRRRGGPEGPHAPGGDRPPGRRQSALAGARPGRAHGRAGADGARRSSSPTATTATRPA